MTEAMNARDGELRLKEVLKAVGFESGRAQIKIARHTETEVPPGFLDQRGNFELYQCYQSTACFHDIDVVLSFRATENNRAKFAGAYRLSPPRPATEGDAPEGCEWALKRRADGGFFYPMERLPQLESLEDRLIIQWEGRNWHRHFEGADFRVVEIKPKGRRLADFKDYLDFSLAYQQLRELFANPAAHSDWESALRAVAGVYVILAESTGQLYVGSAYGVEGIWGRWANYAATGHGGNEKLKLLLKTSADYPALFRFSVLQILPKSMDKDLVIAREHAYMSKLGSRVVGLNW
jgi:hypothetical protein